jgi:hypothetical protein
MRAEDDRKTIIRMSNNKKDRMIKKLAAVLILALVMVTVLAAPVSAHPPTPEPSIGVANENAMDGLHEAAGNVNGIAAHVLFFRVSPHGG